MKQYPFYTLLELAENTLLKFFASVGINETGL